MRRKVNNSEIHEIKKYHEVPSEKVQEWSDTIEELSKQIDRYKAENEQLKIKNEYLLNVIKMSEHIEIHTDAYDEMEKGENNKTHHTPHLTNIKTNKNIEEPMKFIKRIAKERADDER